MSQLQIIALVIAGVALYLNRSRINPLGPQTQTRTQGPTVAQVIEPAKRDLIKVIHEFHELTEAEARSLAYKRGLEQLTDEKAKAIPMPWTSPTAKQSQTPAVPNA